MKPNPDRLYELLPPIYRIRDAAQGYPLQALLRVIAEQVDVVEQDIAQLYDNWFIETAQDWAVPYIADLIGYRPVHEAGEPGDVNTTEGRGLNKILIPRREVANTIHYRRSKGALALLETLANDVAGWPARAVEFFKLLGWTQNLDHPHLDRARTVDVRDGHALDLLDGPFDTLAHTVDVRRIDSTRTPGRYNIPSVGLFVWRLKVYPVTQTPAYCLEQAGPHCYTFSVLGQDTPLYIKPQPETDPVHIAGEMNLPMPIRRRPFERHMSSIPWRGTAASRSMPIGPVTTSGSHCRRSSLRPPISAIGPTSRRATASPSIRCWAALPFRQSNCPRKYACRITAPLVTTSAAVNTSDPGHNLLRSRSIAWAQKKPTSASVTHYSNGKKISPKTP